MQLPQHVRGFTLIEILVVIAVIGILAAAGFLSLLGYLRSQQLKDGAQQLAGDIERVRNGAARYNTDATLEIINATSYRMTINGAATTASLPNNLQLVSTPANATLVYRAPYSEFSGVPVTLTVKQSGTNKQATLRTVGVTGKVVQDAS